MIALLLACAPSPTVPVRCWDAHDREVYVGECPAPRIAIEQYEDGARYVCAPHGLLSARIVIEVTGGCRVGPVEPTELE